MHEEKRKSRSVSLLAQEGLPQPDPFVINMLKEKLEALPKAKAPSAAQLAFGKGGGAKEQERQAVLDRIGVQEALAEPDLVVLGALKEKLQTLPKVITVQVADPKTAEPEAVARDAAALEVVKQRQMTKKAEWETEQRKSVEYWEEQKTNADKHLAGLAQHAKQTRENFAAAMIQTNATLKLMNEYANASVSQTRLAGVDRDCLTEAWGAQVSTLSLGASQFKDEIGAMMNNMLRHASLAELGKAASSLSGSSNGDIALLLNPPPQGGEAAPAGDETDIANKRKAAADEDQNPEPPIKKVQGEIRDMEE